jgi:hypothetical protein
MYRDVCMCMYVHEGNVSGNLDLAIALCRVILGCVCLLLGFAVSIPYSFYDM